MAAKVPGSSGPDAPSQNDHNGTQFEGYDRWEPSSPVGGARRTGITPIRIGPDGDVTSLAEIVRNGVTGAGA